MYPDEPFLPRAPDPEEIVLGGDEESEQPIRSEETPNQPMAVGGEMPEQTLASGEPLLHEHMDSGRVLPGDINATGGTLSDPPISAREGVQPEQPISASEGAGTEQPIEIESGGLSYT